jgi:PAS domain S-box-containing protein
MVKPDETPEILAALGLNDVSSVQQFAEIKSYLENLIENASAVVIGVDRHRQVTVWNGGAARLTGVERGSALGRPLAEFVTAGTVTALEALLERTLGGEVVNGVDLLLVRAAGGEARVTFNTAPVRNTAGLIDGVVAIGQDQTRLRHLEAAAEQAEKMAVLGRLAAGIVHEVNNPLVAVTMYAESLFTKWSSGKGDPADLEKIVGIRDAGLRIQKLTRDLAAYARPGAGKSEALELEALLEQAAMICKPALKEVDAVLEREFEAVSLVTGSRSSMVQVFVNLITNAAQAIQKGGTIRLGLRAGDGTVRVTVADDGEGMTPETKQRLFEPFFTTRSGRGVGLGLATVKGILERHGATVEVESEPGKGTSVTVALPVQLLPGTGGPQVSGLNTA